MVFWQKEDEGCNCIKECFLIGIVKAGQHLTSLHRLYNIPSVDPYLYYMEPARKPLFFLI